MNQSRILFVAMLGAILTVVSCSWFGSKTGIADPTTVAHLEWLQSASTPRDSCHAFVAQEDLKVKTKSPMADKKSLSDMKKVCDCFDKADPNVAMEMTACKDKITVALVHEHQKSSK